ncbi:hypothetical protein F5X96DRAFT_683155 [Biscogniauxia mediterranea]|nr:hypothetical protein F5X96DRAFT_683155 [Biscogniauxia mediterranea]
MPPRIPVSARLAAQCCKAPLDSSARPSLANLFAALSVQQTRTASILASLSDNPGAHQKRIRVGRGPSSGKGKTSGRGHKGQKQHGKVKPWFQGGQTPLIFQRGKLGFENFRAPVMSEVNLDKLQDWIDAGRIDPTKQITPKELVQSNLVGTIKDGIKLLARGGDSLKQPIDIIISRASRAAIEAVEKAGGKILTRYYTKKSIERLVAGKSINTDLPLPTGPEYVEPILEQVRKKGFSYRLPDPTSRWDMEYYRDPAHRGYLSHLLKPGDSPSLFFRVPPAKLLKIYSCYTAMSLFGTSPPNESSSLGNSSIARSRNSLFEDDGDDDGGDKFMTRSNSDALFNDDDFGSSHSASPWDVPTPRKQQSRAELLAGLLADAQIPDNYIEAFDKVVREDGSGGKITSSGVAKTLASAKLAADDQARIASILAPGGQDIAIGRNEFNVLLALIGLAQEGEAVSLDGVDERRRNLPRPQLSSIITTTKPTFPNPAELAAKPPQHPDPPSLPQPTPRNPSMDGPDDDPWNAPDDHANHHRPVTPKTNGHGLSGSAANGNGYAHLDAPDLNSRTTSNFTTSTMTSVASSSAPPSAVSASEPPPNPGVWGFLDTNNNVGGGFGEPPSNHATSSPFGVGVGVGGGGGSGHRGSSGVNPSPGHSRTISGGRTGNMVEENIVVTLMPEKEGMFMFQHHNYEVASARRGSKVIRRYSDFVWLLDCLHKRYPFRVLPLLPPKRVAVNGNHLSNDGAFIEKRRRGLARFLNAVVRHPVLGQEQLVIMFLTVPTELAVWRKQASISVVDEFTGRALPPGLEDSLPSTLNDLFERTKQGVKRSAELYISTCNIMDRLVKRSEGVAADHARLALSLASLTEVSGDTYATDTNDVPLLNDGLIAMSKHLRTSQSLMEDESRAWDIGVLEDLKRQRDALVSVRDMFDRRDRLDRDNIPYLERRIQNNETKLASLRAKQDGLVKPGEIEKVVESIIKDKESIVNQHNRSVFVKECIRDELVYFQQTQYHVSRWNQDWAQERVKYSEMLADNWRRLLDELEGMPLGD